MSADGVKAGRAYVELSVKDRLTKGLAQAKERLAGWAKGLALTGTAIQAGSASVLTALGAAVHHFADQGSRLNDMSVATGVSVETLSGLGYAAQQTGVDLGSLQGGLKGLAKFTGNVAAGSKGAIHTLQQLGISASTFLAARPEQRLGLLADGLRKIQDPGVRAALAMKTLGRAGESLLPMLADGSAGLDAFLERARELGIVITGEEAAKADALGDAWDDLKAVFGAIAFQTGAALADTMQALIATAITGAQAVLEFVRSNQGLAARVIGGARILWRESGVGTKWAVMRLADVPQAIVHFQLQVDLVLGGSALASILIWDGGDWVPSDATILVRDWYKAPGMWQAYGGYKGLALKNACLDRYEIVWMETPARSIEFVLGGKMTGGQAPASVTNYYLQGKSPGSSVTVYDAQGNYPRALAGAKGKARWNDRLRRYEIVECNQMAIALACTLGSDMCAGTSAGSISGHTVLTFPPYGQTPDPLPGAARNYYHLAGRSGDWCLVLWDEDIQDWAIAQVAHHEIEVPIRYRYYDGYLQAKHRKIAVMYCEDETDWRNEIKLEESEFVDGVRFTGCDNGGTGGAGGGTGGSPGETGGDTPAPVQSGSSGGGCGSIEYHTVKGYFFEPPKPAASKNVLTFQEQAVLVAAAGGGSCITFQEVTVCTPCVGPGDTSQVCANVKTSVACQCSCSCNCDCNCGDSGGYYPASGGGSGGGGCSCSCSCTCTCQANSVITFG
jgi:hypothetical protein